MLKIKDVTAAIHDSTVLEDIELEVNSKEIHAILGPKESGKSSLVQTILGNPILDLKKGSITFNNKSIKNKAIYQRSLLGIFTTFQYLPVLEGITNFEFVRAILKSHRDTRTDNEVEKEYKSLLKKLELSSNHGQKIVNDDSMTLEEHRRNELLHMFLLDPDLLIFDEIDKELNEEEIVWITQQIKSFISNTDKSVIIVTQNINVLNILEPTHVNIMVRGKIKAKGNKTLYKRIIKDGYSQFS